MKNGVYYYTVLVITIPSTSQPMSSFRPQPVRQLPLRISPATEISAPSLSHKASESSFPRISYSSEQQPPSPPPRKIPSYYLYPQFERNPKENTLRSKEPLQNKITTYAELYKATHTPEEIKEQEKMLFDILKTQASYKETIPLPPQYYREQVFSILEPESQAKKDTLPLPKVYPMSDRLSSSMQNALAYVSTEEAREAIKLKQDECSEAFTEMLSNKLAKLLARLLFTRSKTIQYLIKRNLLPQAHDAIKSMEEGIDRADSALSLETKKVLPAEKAFFGNCLAESLGSSLEQLRTLQQNMQKLPVAPDPADKQKQDNTQELIKKSIATLQNKVIPRLQQFSKQIPSFGMPDT